MTAPICFVILGQPCSKANSREIVLRKKKGEDGTSTTRPVSIKSDAALAYEAAALKQVPPRARVQLQGPVRVTLRLFYASERPDLDESIVLDVLQDRYTKNKHTGERVLIQRGVYANDRQVREKHVYHFIDRANPRAEIEVEAVQAQQVGLELRSEEDVFS